MTNKHLARAAELAPLIERVHGANHPELTRVRELTEQLVTADAAASRRIWDEVRVVTQDYKVPSDGCEAFQATYQALARADEASLTVESR